ncbi:MAG: HAMP domain-containing histidine kinase [Synergistaceae bacterium]|jgi:signal transduction histidine kinase|nr:HAMP domain-containing histidine kinase [Synergistaceae bacterium]
MNIKRRLFISNILMIVIPLVVSLAVFYGGLHVFATLAGLRDDRRRGGNSFMEASERADTMAERWREEGADIETMLFEARGFNAGFGGRGPVLVLYRGGEMVSGVRISPPDDILDRALAEEGDAVIFGRTAARVWRVGEYRAVLFEGLKLARMYNNYGDVMLKGTILSFVCSVLIILLTNRFLTQFVFRRILHAMDTLTDGVRQIRDGNLGFRIAYGEQDEFSSVCDDFNRMADRLLDVETARRKDEQSRRELVAGISHDLRTPLTSVKAYVEGLERGIASTPDAARRYLDTIKSKTDDLEHIIDTLFLFAKLDTGEFPYHMERVELWSVVSETALAAAEEYGPRGLLIETAGGGARAYVRVDAAQMRFVLFNIFENSLKYRAKDRARLDISMTVEEGYAVLNLSDDGPGVPDEALDKLFGLFYRLDGSRSNPSKGSGLGLAIVAKMIGHFGGSIEAGKSDLGGLAIVIRLPVSPA